MKHGKTILALVAALALSVVAGQASADSRDRDRHGSNSAIYQVHMSGHGHDKHWKQDARRHHRDHRDWSHRRDHRDWRHHGNSHKYYKHNRGHAYGSYYHPRAYVVRPYVAVPRYYGHDGHHSTLNILLKF